MPQNKKNSIIENVFEGLIYLFIICAPINNMLNSLGIYATAAYLASALLIVGFILSLICLVNRGGRRFGITTVVLLLAVQILVLQISGKSIDITVFFPFLSFCLFVISPTNVSLKNVYCSFYIASIIAAIASFAFGRIDANTVERTAGLVDGSIAVICLTIALFAKENFKKTRQYKTLKTISIAASVVVAAFGMSRSRILLIAIMIVIKLLLVNKDMVFNPRIPLINLVGSVFVIIMVVIITQTNLYSFLYDAIALRYSGGFNEITRNNEIQAGIQWFTESWLFGKGWGRLVYGRRLYQNHCMYVALFARGGIFLGSAVIACLVKLVKFSFKQKNVFCIMMLFVFFVLAYGNAGFFNYTISSLFIPLVATLNQDLSMRKSESE